MSLHPTMKRRLHERLHPLIGEEEADALLDEISPADPVTREWLEGRFDRIDDRFARIDDRFDRIDERFARVDDRMVTREDLDERLGRFATKEWAGDRFDRLVTREDLDERLGRFATKEWTEDRFYVKEQLDLKLGSMEDRILTTMADRFTQHTLLTVAGLGGAATIISIVQAIWG